MDFEIRRLQQGDEQLVLQAVLDLKPEDERGGRQPSIQHLRRFLAQDTNYLIIASKDSVPIGFLTAYRMLDLFCDASMVYLYEIKVAPPYRRQGIGKRMVNMLKTECKEGNVEEIWVATEKENVAAKQLYERTGAICESPDQCEFVYQLKNIGTGGRGSGIG